MASFCVLLVAFTVFSTLKASLLPDDRYFNEEDPCEDFIYDGRRLPFAEVLIGERMFDSRNCGMVVSIDEVNTEIPIVRFSEVRTLVSIMAVYDCLKSSAAALLVRTINTPITLFSTERDGNRLACSLLLQYHIPCIALVDGQKNY